MRQPFPHSSLPNNCTESFYEVYKSASNPKPCKVKIAMAKLAQDKRLLSHITQNFDCCPARFTSLAEKTMMCHIRSEHTIQVRQIRSRNWHSHLARSVKKKCRRQWSKESGRAMLAFFDLRYYYMQNAAWMKRKSEKFESEI